MTNLSLVALLTLLLISSLISGKATGEQTEDKEKTRVDFPHTDIFIFNLDLNSSEMVLSDGNNATQRAGYDNQPYFTSNSESFIYSRADDYQTDVYEYFLKTKQIKRLTQSSATEFSPTPSPNNAVIAFVSDRNGGIWFGDRSKLDEPKWVLESSDNREPVGYFAWNHETEDLLYWSRYGFSMALVNRKTGSYHFVSGNTPPSTPHIIPGTQKFSFVHRQTNGQVWIKELDPNTKSIRPLIAVNGSNMNYTWTPDGSILMVQNNKLNRWENGSENGWSTIADLAALGINNANRLAVSPDGKRLAVVGVGY